MRLKALTFDRYGAGETDFSTLLSTTEQPAKEELEADCQVIAGLLAPPIPNQFVSIIVVGHADRQDLSHLSCNERRASEIAAAEARATSAWAWIKEKVAQEATTLNGVDPGDWWETATHVTWGLVYAAAGMLKHDPPTEEERPLNRRIVVLISIFVGADQ